MAEAKVASRAGISTKAMSQPFTNPTAAIARTARMIASGPGQACVDQRAVRRRASHHRRDLRQVEATGNDHDRHAAAQKDEGRRVGENDGEIPKRRETRDGQCEENDQRQRDGEDDRLEQAASWPPRQLDRRGRCRLRHGISPCRRPWSEGSPGLRRGLRCRAKAPPGSCGS